MVEIKSLQQFSRTKLSISLRPAEFPRDYDDEAWRKRNTDSVAMQASGSLVLSIIILF
jgi:hypothetical protein